MDRLRRWVFQYSNYKKNFKFKREELSYSPFYYRLIHVPDRLNVKSIFGIIYRVLANEGQLTENDRQTTSDHNSSFL